MPLYKMSSAFRGHISIPTSSQAVNTKFVNLTTLCYVDSSVSGGYPVPIPFSYNNGVLDINIQDNVEDDLISGEGSIVPFNFNMVRQLGGRGVVSSLGPNLLTWLNNEYGSYDFKIDKQAIVTKVQMNKNIGDDPFDFTLGQFSASGFSTSQPSSDDYILTGSPADNYGTFYVFVSPLTISYVDGATTYYLVLHSTFTKNIFGAP